MADYDLVRDILDEQLVDASDRRLGKADGVLMELRADAPPRLVAIQVGLPVLGYRLHPVFGRALERLNRWMNFQDAGRAQLSFEGMEVRATEVKVEVDAEATGALAWERWLRHHVVARIPGGRSRGETKSRDKPSEKGKTSGGESSARPAEPTWKQSLPPALGVGGTPVHLERVIGRKVLAPGGRSIGRLEEVRVERQGKELVVSEYLIGTLALLERLSTGLLRTHEGGIGHGYRAWWHQLDLSDPLHPRLACPPGELREL